MPVRLRGGGGGGGASSSTASGGDGLLGGLVGELQGLGRQAGVGVFLDEGLFLVGADLFRGDDEVLFLPALAADRGELGGGVGEGRRLLADVEVQDRLVRGLGGRGWTGG
jgi:hypothetical protein